MAKEIVSWACGSSKGSVPKWRGKSKCSMLAGTRNDLDSARRLQIVADRVSEGEERVSNGLAGQLRSVDAAVVGEASEKDVEFPGLREEGRKKKIKTTAAK